MGMFDGINEAKTATERAYFKEGAYRVEVETVSSISADKSFKGKNSFIIQGKILESTNPECPPGSSAGQVITWAPGNAQSQPTQMAFGNVRQFLEAAMGEEVANIQEAADLVTTSANPLRGMVLGLRCQSQSTKVGGVYTKHTWRKL